VIDQRSVTLAPTVNPVTPLVDKVVVVTVAVPAITLQLPLPELGTFPAKVVVVTLQRF